MSDTEPMQVDIDLVRALAELLDHNALTEIEVEDGARRIRVARHAAMVAPTPAPLPTQVLSPPASGPAAATGTPNPPEAAAGTLRSPMVGTAFLTPEPGAAPFATEGDSISEGQTLLIIEAMKVMNPIVAPRAGRLVKMLVAHEQPVEFDQALLVIG